MSMLSNLDLLRRVPMFSKLGESQLQLLAAEVSKRRIKRGQPVVVQGQQTEALFIILSGRCRVLMTDPKGREVILAQLNPGDHLGEMSLIDRQPHSATVETEIQTDVLVLGRDVFLRCLAGSSTMAYSILCDLVRRLRLADRKIGSLALMTVYGRVADVLLERAWASPEKDMVIRDKISRQDLAKMVGASREMVSRVMKDFEARGFVQTLPDEGLRVHARLSRLR